jgi:hypothetical protein
MVHDRSGSIRSHHVVTCALLHERGTRVLVRNIGRDHRVPGWCWRIFARISEQVRPHRGA